MCEKQDHVSETRETERTTELKTTAISMSNQSKPESISMSNCRCIGPYLSGTPSGVSWVYPLPVPSRPCVVACVVVVLLCCVIFTQSLHIGTQSICVIKQGYKIVKFATPNLTTIVRQKLSKIDNYCQRVHPAQNPKNLSLLSSPPNFGIFPTQFVTKLLRL